MNSGGEPERDDTGLPPVDIEIPDDARELDRDVQAYYREQRAERRRLRHHKLHGRITRDGIALPLLACCLILALIIGTLLTVFTATSEQNLIRPPVPGTGTSGPAAHEPASSGQASRTPSARSRAGSGGGALAHSPVVVDTGAPLPRGTLRLAANDRPIHLRHLGESMLVLVPRACRCATTVSWLAGIGATRGVPTYLVATPQTIGEAKRLNSGLTPSLRTAAPVALDRKSVLSTTYPVHGVTAVLVTGRPLFAQSTAYAQNLSAKDNPAPLLQALTG